jgi:hypothetical protein
MPGGLMQLVGTGAQNTLLNGNPSFTHFKSMYKRYTDFAMEHFRLDLRAKDLLIPTAGTKTFRCKVERYADLLHDVYLCVQLPDIYSPLYRVPQGDAPPASVTNTSTAAPYQFQWIKNLGYNMIESISLLFNGTTIVQMTGEWMKLYSYMQYDRNKRFILDQMTGNVPELYDPANANGRRNQYPNSMLLPTTAPGLVPSPSIQGRQLVIPIPFWFCENVGKALPLVAMNQTEVEISITLRNVYDLFTVLDIRDPAVSPTSGQRIPGNPGVGVLAVNNFLSPPNADGTASDPTRTTWNLDPYFEANYIFLTQTERVHVATTEHVFLVHQLNRLTVLNQFGFNENLIPMFNLCTRIVWALQRNDRAILNDWDNYTNWEDPNIPPYNFLQAAQNQTLFYSAGVQQPNQVNAQNIMEEATVIFDGKERFKTKPESFFHYLQFWKHGSGSTDLLPGINLYSFALNHNQDQPSGAANGSMFNKTLLRYTLQVPPVSDSAPPPTERCVFKNTLFGTPITANPATSSPNDVVHIIESNQDNIFEYKYQGNIYVESFNFVRILQGLANVVFTS